MSDIISFKRVTPNEGETFKDVTERLSLRYYQGSGYYQLIKSENISANKDLVLKKKDGTWLAGGTAVRSALGLNSGRITVKPADFSADCEMFIQSTSSNRKLPSGHDVLFRLNEALASGSINVSTDPGAKSGKRKRGDDDDDGGDGDGKDDSGGEDQIVVWPSLIFDLTDEVECLDENDLVVGASASNVPGDCDLPVPNNSVLETTETIHNDAIRAVSEWIETERLVVPVPDSSWGGAMAPHVRCQWKSAAGNIRLMYVQFANGTFVALEIPQKRWGLVCGNCGAHPFCHSPTFMYANSDGSSSDINLPKDSITHATVLAKLMHDTVLHCSNVEH